MGNNPQNPSQTFLIKNWQPLSHNTYRNTITDQLIRQYSISYNNHQQLQNAHSSYVRRANLSHPNIVKMIYFYQDNNANSYTCSSHDSKLKVYLEYVGVSLRNVIQQQNMAEKRFDDRICLQIVNGINYLKQFYGFFKANLSMLFLTNQRPSLKIKPFPSYKSKNYIKAWIHSRVQKQQPQFPCSQPQMCKSIINILGILQSHKLCSQIKNKQISSIKSLEELVHAINLMYDSQPFKKKLSSTDSENITVAPSQRFFQPVPTRNLNTPSSNKFSVTKVSEPQINVFQTSHGNLFQHSQRSRCKTNKIVNTKAQAFEPKQRVMSALIKVSPSTRHVKNQPSQQKIVFNYSPERQKIVNLSPQHKVAVNMSPHQRPAVNLSPQHKRMTTFSPQKILISKNATAREMMFTRTKKSFSDMNRARSPNAVIPQSQRKIVNKATVYHSPNHNHRVDFSYANISNKQHENLSKIISPKGQSQKKAYVSIQSSQNSNKNSQNSRRQNPFKNSGTHLASNLNIQSNSTSKSQYSHPQQLRQQNSNKVLSKVIAVTQNSPQILKNIVKSQVKPAQVTQNNSFLNYLKDYILKDQHKQDQIVKNSSQKSVEDNLSQQLDIDQIIKEEVQKIDREQAQKNHRKRQIQKPIVSQKLLQYQLNLYGSPNGIQQSLKYSHTKSIDFQIKSSEKHIASMKNVTFSSSQLHSKLKDLIQNDQKIDQLSQNNSQSNDQSDPQSLYVRVLSPQKQKQPSNQDNIFYKQPQNIIPDNHYLNTSPKYYQQAQQMSNRQFPQANNTFSHSFNTKNQYHNKDQVLERSRKKSQSEYISKSHHQKRKKSFNNNKSQSKLKFIFESNRRRKAQNDRIRQQNQNYSSHLKQFQKNITLQMSASKATPKSFSSRMNQQFQHSDQRIIHHLAKTGSCEDYNMLQQSYFRKKGKQQAHKHGKNLVLKKDLEGSIESYNSEQDKKAALLKRIQSTQKIIRQNRKKIQRMQLQKDLQKQKQLIKREMQTVMAHNTSNQFNKIKQKVRQKRANFAQLKAQASKILEDFNF